MEGLIKSLMKRKVNFTNMNKEKRKKEKFSPHSKTTPKMKKNLS